MSEEQYGIKNGLTNALTSASALISHNGLLYTSVTPMLSGGLTCIYMMSANDFAKLAHTLRGGSDIHFLILVRCVRQWDFACFDKESMSAVVSIIACLWRKASWQATVKLQTSFIYSARSFEKLWQGNSHSKTLFANLVKSCLHCVIFSRALGKLSFLTEAWLPMNSMLLLSHASIGCFSTLEQ